MPAMCTNFASPEGFSTDRIKAYYAARARGGAGLIITGNAYIEGGKSMVRQLGIDNRDKVAKLRELTDAIHAEGGKICVQLNHGGRNSLASIAGRRPVAPSPIPSFRYVDGDLPQELDVEGILGLIEAYRKASLLSIEAGFDAIELHAAHGYLISQFLSGYTNRRSDRYGGPIENRVLFLREVLRAVRDAVGGSFPALVRISAEEFVPGGNTIEEAKYIARVIEEEGGDVVDVSMGQGPSSPEDRDYQVVRLQNIPPMDFPAGCWVDYASQIKEVVTIPVIAVGRIHDPELAEGILQDGKADLIAMGRALIADPELPKKLAEGRVHDIRQCISCNQGCQDRVYRLEDIECLINAQVGREEEWKIHPATKRKRVLVVGGGPGGMEAARVAAIRGHEVVLIERSDDLGGQLQLVAIVPFREPWGQYVAHQRATLEQLHVEIVTGKEAAIEDIKSIKPDVVILATGGSPMQLSLAGRETANLASAWDVLSRKVVAATPTVVIGGGAVGLETAELISKAGNQVTVVEMLEQVGSDMNPGILALILDRLKRANVQIITRTKAVELKLNGVVVQRHEGRSVLPATTVVEAVGVVPNDELKELLDSEGIESISIGDCKEPRKAYQAVHEGFLAALSI